MKWRHAPDLKSPLIRLDLQRQWNAITICTSSRTNTYPNWIMGDDVLLSDPRSNAYGGLGRYAAVYRRYARSSHTASWFAGVHSYTFVRSASNDLPINLWSLWIRGSRISSWHLVSLIASDTYSTVPRRLVIYNKRIRSSSMQFSLCAYVASIPGQRLLKERELRAEWNGRYSWNDR